MCVDGVESVYVGGIGLWTGDIPQVGLPLKSTSVFFSFVCLFFFIDSLRVLVERVLQR